MVKHAKPRTRDSDSEDLLSRMDEEMVLRGFARGTRRLYLAHVRVFWRTGGLNAPWYKLPPPLYTTGLSNV